MAIAMTSPERRRTPRLSVERIAYINFNEHNGGIILNASEGGLCFRSIGRIQADGAIRFWLSNRGRRIEGEGRLAWADDTQTRGGLCFTNMSPQTCEEICGLITEPRTAPAAGFPGRKPGDSKPNRAHSVQLIRASAEAVRRRLCRGFSGGLITGVLCSLVIAGGFVYRREAGEWLIRLGERLASKPLSTAVSPQAPIPSRTPALGLNTVRPEGLPELPSPKAPTMFATSPQEAQRTQGAAPSSEESDEVLVFHNLGNQAPHPSPRPEPAIPAPVISGDSTRAALALGTAPIPSLPLPPVSTRAGASNPTSPIHDSTLRIESSRPQISSGSSQMYFEIGKFKEHFWATEEENKLAQLGFPATILQKGHLWMNSYHVLVGPYHEVEEAESAHRNLVLRGFQPRAFERGSRDFALPPRLTLNGGRTPVGECVIRWESYLTDVRVKFEQDDYVMATARARWEQRDPKYENDATVYIQHRDGSRSLVELRFAGMRRALVFGN